jgi:upstream activation factor subunit UAF30
MTNAQKKTATKTKDAAEKPAATTPAPTPKTKKQPAATAATTTAAAAETVQPTDKPAEKSEIDEKTSIIVEIHSDITHLTNLLKQLQSKFKLMTKDYEKQLKIFEKEKVKKENAKKSPSGFAKPCVISDELCEFMEMPSKSEVSRTEVTRFINNYVKKHDLHDPKNKRIIKPDNKLKKILKVKDGDEISFFNLQKLISPHFPESNASRAERALREMNEREKNAKK